MEMSRIKIFTIDRPKMTFDVASIFVKHNISITWMEVYTYVIYVKFPKQEEDIWNQMKIEFNNIPGIKDVEEVDFIILEEKELEVRTVLNSISQGIVIVDKNSKIKYLNQYAAQNIFQIKKDDGIGISINNFDKTHKIGQLLETDSVKIDSHSKEIVIKNKSYIVSASPIISDDEKLSSFMVTFEDINRLGEIFNIKRFDNPITFKDIKGISYKIKNTINQAIIYAHSDSPVLILGESGTGKELFARAIHNESLRSSKIFIALNCAAIPEQLIESELFGYDEGAFTGGKKSGKIGLLEIANGGTIFLDEIGEMPPHLQVKLLRVIQEKSIRKLGSNKELPINVRIITATNRDINKMVASNQFRLDLYYRINVFTLTIPPLRERNEDVGVLTTEFIKVYLNRYNKNTMMIHPEAMEYLKHYPWPGNVRELQNVIERAIALTETNVIHLENIKVNEIPCERVIDYNLPLKQRIEKIEKDLIQEALSDNYSIRETAKRLGVTHTLLINRMKKYKIT